MNIALTGGSGFIGSVIAKHVAKQWHSVAALVRETSRRDRIKKYVSKFIRGSHDESNAAAALPENSDVATTNAAITGSFDSSLAKALDLF